MNSDLFDQVRTMARLKNSSASETTWKAPGIELAIEVSRFAAIASSMLPLKSVRVVRRPNR